jgi:hypothetical protein
MTRKEASREKEKLFQMENEYMKKISSQLINA